MFGFCKYVPRNLFYSVQLPLFPNRHFSWQIFWLIIAGKAPVLLITNHGSVSCIGVPVCRLSLCVMSNVFREEGANFFSVSILYKMTAFGRTSAPYFSPPTSDSWIRRCRLSLWLKVTHICQLPMYHLRSELRQPVMNEPASFARYDAGWLAVQNKSTWHELSGVQSSPPFAKVVFQFSCLFLIKVKIQQSKVTFQYEHVSNRHSWIQQVQLLVSISGVLWSYSFICTEWMMNEKIFVPFLISCFGYFTLLNVSDHETKHER